MSRRAVHADPAILPQGAIIEFVSQGGYVKVSAVDPMTFEEVSIVGDPAVSERELSRIAVRKLERMIERKYPNKVARRRGQATAERRPDPPSGWDL